MQRCAGVLAVVSLCAACAPTTQGGGRSELEALRVSMREQDRSLNDTAASAARLSAEWQDVALAYGDAATSYQAAARRYAEAQAHAENAEHEFNEASAQWRKASTEYRFFQALMLVAAQVDAANLDSFRAWRTSGGEGLPRDFSCAPVSTATFRRLLIAQGVDLAGLDVDHIVPHSLGGADHPGNYQLLPSSVNRSIGNQWDREKCLAVAERCAQAVAVSRKCGEYRGTLP